MKKNAVGIFVVFFCSCCSFIFSVQAQAPACPLVSAFDAANQVPQAELADLDYPLPFLGAIGTGNFMTITRGAPTASLQGTYQLTVRSGQDAHALAGLTFPYQHGIDGYFSNAQAGDFQMCNEDGKNCSTYQGQHGGWNHIWRQRWPHLYSERRVTYAESLDADLTGDGVPEFAVGTRCIMSQGGYPKASDKCCFRKGELNVYDGASGRLIYTYAPDRGRRPYIWAWGCGGMMGWYWSAYYLVCDGKWGNPGGFFATAGDIDGDQKPELIIGDPESKKLTLKDLQYNGSKLTDTATSYIDPATSSAFAGGLRLPDGITLNVPGGPQLPGGMVISGPGGTYLTLSPVRSFGTSLTILNDRRPNSQGPIILAADPRYPWFGTGPTSDGGMLFAFRPPAYSSKPAGEADMISGIPDIFGAHFGYALRNIGDHDKDGVDDFIIGAPSSIFPLFLDGGVTSAYSGLTLEPIEFRPQLNEPGNGLFAGDGEYAQFGYALDGGHDMNADGTPDIIISAPGDENGIGLVRIFSGIDKQVLYELEGTTAGQRFGQGVAALGGSRVVIADGRGHFEIYQFGADSNNDGIADRCQGLPPPGPTPTPAPDFEAVLQQVRDISSRMADVLKGLGFLARGLPFPSEIIVMTDIAQKPYSFKTERRKKQFVEIAIARSRAKLAEDAPVIRGLISNNQPALKTYHNALRAEQAQAIRTRMTAIRTATGTPLKNEAVKFEKLMRRILNGAKPKS